MFGTIVRLKNLETRAGKRRIGLGFEAMEHVMPQLRLSTRFTAFCIVASISVSGHAGDDPSLAKAPPKLKLCEWTEDIEDGVPVQSAGWTMIGPGDADQATSVSELSDGSIVVGSDIGGLYFSVDQGCSWRPGNRGLLNYDITTKIVQHPTTPDTLFVGTRGGFYKSIDGGNSWVSKRTGLPKVQSASLSGSIGALAIDQKNPDRLFLGIGYRRSSAGSRTVRGLSWGSLIYASNDGGEVWRSIKVFDDPSSVTSIKVAKSGTVYVASSTGMYISHDGETEWRRIYNDIVYDFLIFDNNPARIMLATGENGILESHNHGVSWRKENHGPLSEFAALRGILLSNQNRGNDVDVFLRITAETLQNHPN